MAQILSHYCVTVKLKNSTQSSLTNADGVFTINVPVQDCIRVSYIGYEMVKLDVPASGEIYLCYDKN